MKMKYLAGISCLQVQRTQRGHKVLSLYFILPMGDDPKRQMYFLLMEAKPPINYVSALKINL